MTTEALPSVSVARSIGVSHRNASAQAQVLSSARIVVGSGGYSNMRVVVVTGGNRWRGWECGGLRCKRIYSIESKILFKKKKKKKKKRIMIFHTHLSNGIFPSVLKL